ncbi:MAG: hypothetical protein V3S26_09880 [Acidimicrobiia bacterium]
MSLRRFSGEVITRVIEVLGPDSLGVARRLAEPDVPIAAAREIEEVVIPSVQSISAAVLANLG